jgi:beta-lactamase regulating signal transducer with metallopeptidase domain
MNWLTSFLPLHTSQALGWTLIHSLWQAGLAALVIAALFALLPRLSPQTRAALSYGGVVLVVVLAGITFARQSGSDSLVTFTRSLLEPGTVASAPAAVPALSRTGLSLSDISGLIMNGMPALTGLWLLGVALALGRLGRGVWQLRRLRRERHLPVSGHLLHRLHVLSRRFKLTRPVRILAGKHLTTPIVYGHLRPVILFPLALLASVSPEQIEALLAHELAHIKRHDYLLNLLMRVFRSFFFFNPGFLWLARTWENEREYCCDGMATAAGVKPVCLAEALLGIRERQLAMLALTPAALGQGPLGQRIRRIFGEPLRSEVRFGAGLPLLLALVTAGLWLLGSPRGVTASEFFHGLNDLTPVAEEAQRAETAPAVWSVKSDEEWKKQVEKLEILRQKIELLRLEKRDGKRDEALNRLEKDFTTLARALVRQIPPPPPPVTPVAAVAPVSSAPPQSPLPALAPVPAVSPQEPPLLSVPPQPLEPAEPLEPLALEDVQLKLQELKLVKEELQLKAQAEREAELEKARVELEMIEARLSAEQTVQEAKMREEEAGMVAKMKAEQKKVIESLKGQEEELAAMEKKLAEEQKVLNHFEQELQNYLIRHGLIRSAALMKIEIQKEKILLNGKALNETHSRALRKLAQDILGDRMRDSDSRIVIQR